MIVIKMAYKFVWTVVPPLSVCHWFGSNVFLMYAHHYVGFSV